MSATSSSARSVGPAGPVGPGTYVRPPLSRPEKYERLAFTFCRMGTVGLISWAVTPAVFVLAVAVVAIALYARSISLGVSWSKCFLRRPTYILGFWALVAAAVRTGSSCSASDGRDRDVATPAMTASDLPRERGSTS